MNNLQFTLLKRTVFSKDTDWHNMLLFWGAKSVCITVQALCVILTAWRKFKIRELVLYAQAGLRHCTNAPSAGQKFSAISKNIRGTWAFWETFNYQSLKRSWKGWEVREYQLTSLTPLWRISSWRLNSKGLYARSNVFKTIKHNSKYCRAQIVWYVIELM